MVIERKSKMKQLVIFFSKLESHTFDISVFKGILLRYITYSKFQYYMLSKITGENIDYIRYNLTVYYIN